VRVPALVGGVTEVLARVAADVRGVVMRAVAIGVTLFAGELVRSGVPPITFAASQTNSASVNHNIAVRFEGKPGNLNLGFLMGASTGGFPLTRSSLYLGIALRRTNAPRGVPSGLVIDHQYSSVFSFQSGLAR